MVTFLARQYPSCLKAVFGAAYRFTLKGVCLKCKAFASPYTGVVLLHIED
jgi:hypothetical protein